MGGRGRAWQGQQGQDGRHASWQLWRGSWASPKQGDSWRQPATGHFPTYDSVPTKGKGKTKLEEALHAAGIGHFGGPLQTALNGARKAEQRVMKLHQARTAAEEQWQAYCQKMKDGYLKEKHRFQQNNERIGKELIEAEAVMSAARAGVTQAAHEAAACTGPAPAGQEATQDDSVEQMFSAWDAEAAPDWDGVLHRAMDATTSVTPQRPTQRVPRTPQQGQALMTAEQRAQAAHAYMTMLAGAAAAVRDPYLQASPVITAPEASGNPTGGYVGEGHAPTGPAGPKSGNTPHTGQRDMGKPRAPTSVEAPRANIKDASKAHAPAEASANPGLAEKLEQKRQSAKALFAFGQIPVDRPTGDNGPTRSVNIVQDDDEDDDALMTGVEQGAKHAYRWLWDADLHASFALTLPDQPRFVEDPLRPEEGLQHCLDVIKDRGPRRPIVVALLDLTAVGGRYFACYLARTLPYQELIAFVTPQIQERALDLVIRIGEAQEPHAPGQPLQLEDGDVISVVLQQQQPIPKPSAAEICADRSCWGPLSRLPYFSQADVVLAQYHQKQFCVSMCRQFGRTLTEVLASKFELDPEEMTTCSFRTPGLELHGEVCSHIVMLVDLPAAQITVPRRKMSLRAMMKMMQVMTKVAHPMTMMTMAIAGIVPPTDGAQQQSPAVAGQDQTTEVRLLTDVVLGGLGGPRLGDQADFVAQAAQQGLEVAQVEQEPPMQRGELDVHDPATLEGPGQALADGVYLVTCLVYAPDYIPDIVVQAIAIPCSVNHAIAAFAQRRDSNQATCFDQLFPAAPQPDNKLPVLVALPSWETQRIVILFNCLACNRTIFAAAVFPWTNKASLLHAAGIREHQAYDVFLHGLLQPVPDLVGTWKEDMLQDPTEWDFEAPIPGPPPPAGDHFWVLSEGIPRLFRVERDRRRSIVTDIAHALQYTTDHVTVQPTRPRIIDHLGFGCPTWAVVVATETLQTIPYPPARRPESRKILVLDCRAILAGFRWQLVAGGQITVQEIADQFHEVCPPNFLVVLKGADIFHTPDGQAIQVTNGLIVKIEFVEEAPLESAESEAVEPLTSDEDMGPETSGNGGPPTNDEAPGPDTASCEGSVAAAGLSPRSRSPRDRYTNDTNDQNPIMEGAEGVDFRAFGILAPGFCEEIVQVKLEESPLLHHATRAVQAAREANYAQAFPLLQPVSHQPNRHKGYYLATPLWPYQGVIVCIDMLTAWHRIFAVVTSPVADKTALLLCAGLSPAADVDVYANGLGPIEQQLSLRDGDCVTVLWRGMPAPPTLSMQALLEDSESRSAAESDLSSEDDSHYCLVGADGCQLFSLRHQRSAFYRADIALRVGCDPNELQLTPSVPRCDDASMFGFNCCAVVAALRVGHIPLDAHICVSCIDARRLLRAWMPIATSDGWVYLPEVVQTLGTSVPTDWCVYLEGVDEEQTWWYCEPGSILVAACGPAEDRPSVPVSGGTQDAQVDEPACSASTTDTPQAKATQATTMDSVPDACSQRITRTPSMTNCIRRFFRVRSLKSQLTTSCQKDTEEQPLREHDLQTDYAKIGSARGRWGSRLPLMLVVLCHSTTCGGSMHLQGVSRGALRGTAVGLTDVMQVDMWPDGFHDDARARGPHQSTPILPVHRVASTQPVSNLHSACHTLGNGPPAPAKVSTGCGVGTLPCDQYTRRGTIGTIPVATPCRALTKRCNATNKQLVIHPIEEKTVLEELFACEGEQFCFDTWTLLETLTEHFEPLIRKEPELTRRRRGIFSDASSEAFLPPEGKRLSLQDMVPVSLVQQLEGRPHPFAHAPPAALLEDKLRLGGAVPAYEPTGSGQLSAYTAECFALAIVHLYTALRFAHCAVIYKSDCQAAVGIVQGTMSHKTDPYAQVLANAVAFRAAIAPSRDRAEYVPGHAGTFFNESADSMAKKGAVAGHVQGGLTDSVFPFWLHRGGTRLAWAGVMLQRLLGNQAYPSLEGNAGQDTWHAGLSGQQLIAPFIPDGCVRDEPGKDELRSRKTLDLVVSYNTLSLGASLEEADGSGTHDGGLQYRPGRAAILAEQLHAKGANIAALQETRGKIRAWVAPDIHVALAVQVMLATKAGKAPGPASCHSSCFILFTDIASAYYSVVRQLVAKSDSGRAAEDWLRGMDLPLEDLELLARHSENASALQEAGATGWLESLAQRLTDSTWFVLQNDKVPVITTRGTRPGSSWADLLFSFVVRRILQRRDALQDNAGGVVHAPVIPDDTARTLQPCDNSKPLKALEDLIWADDIATMKVADSAVALPRGIKTSVGTSCDSFAEHGFRLSFGRCKTAVLAQPAGDGAKSTRRLLFGAQGMQGEILAMREHAAPAKVPLVSEYRHLGAQVVAALEGLYKVWQRTLDSEEDRETANNMLLLLDVDLLGEIRVTKPAQQPCPADVAPDWTPLPPCSFHANGTGPPLSLQAPPEVILSPFGPTSVTLRAATAYATWLEQACACIARCFIDQREAPSGVVCKGLARSLGPAADWLGAIGSVIDDYGLALQP
ncbi:hypothetical protein AK812_SmicGene4613 [Symbiodinium microadriaticum]|uniref:Uncharacterized protein n=1 Tax=Symbiodinium microadriaticum TaxID=2951 RepID=A0A1Q9EVW2_SYMMI|nr:hypothetical protein AK812_SmicGene4613 [Symbiodinium microadriaticum]CAE7662574.1 unnamed protein product [Symbiodinium sp. KB8]